MYAYVRFNEVTWYVPHVHVRTVRSLRYVYVTCRTRSGCGQWAECVPPLLQETDSYEHLLSTTQGQWQRQLQWHVATDAACRVEAAETRASVTR